MGIHPDNPILQGTGLVPMPSRVRHVKSGGTYRVLAQAKIEHDLSNVIVYQSEKDGSVWVRPAMEFCDGRFEPLSD